MIPGLAVGGRNPLDILVISAGAGFHEELIFRLGIMGGLGWLLTGLTGDKRRWIAWVIAVAVSSVMFSMAHHIGPAGEAFTFMAFVYRTLAGVFFALVYQTRGFAVAAWTHALYDVYVLSLSGG
ncbi:MAG: CPBP family intramembrane metalloprotease [Nannocystaceae bacterium]|nr:CPBP family intramembrane metalloprotease [Nannocystaceae bacterium]